ncbi:MULTISPECIES: methyl-accepting chemotaxis protein [Jannaschia]|uniref:methyl-accepting chemotaxis protein n=1 Tax=Jannaschia TaxID=188905 RepID=UPI001C7D9591|nr:MULTISPECIES: methyl-accepting chemotaxis protein [unclassified Jannaschia]
MRLEKSLGPLQGRLLSLLVPECDDDPDLADDLVEAASCLRSVQDHYLPGMDIVISQSSLSTIVRFADQLTALAKLLTSNEDLDRASLLAHLKDYSAQLEDVLDAMRCDFLGEVLRRQDRARESSDLAAREVSAISRQIYFISINASVEAARAGEAGRGFAVIGEQIRNLSQDTSKALSRMKEATSSP